MKKIFRTQIALLTDAAKTTNTQFFPSPPTKIYFMIAADLTTSDAENIEEEKNVMVTLEDGESVNVKILNIDGDTVNVLIVE